MCDGFIDTIYAMNLTSLLLIEVLNNPGRLFRIYLMLNTTLPDAEFTVHLTQIADIYLVDSTLYSFYSNPNAVVNTFFIPSNSML
jgi:hypothetical protein